MQNKNKKNRNTSYYRTQARKNNKNKFNFYDNAKKRQMSSYLRAITVLFVFMIVVSGFIFLGISLKNLVTESEDSDAILKSSDESISDTESIDAAGFSIDAGTGEAAAALENSGDAVEISQIYYTYNGAYLDIQKLSGTEDLDMFIATIKEKNINAVNIDIKRENGVIPFALDNPTAIAAGSVETSGVEGLQITEIINKLHQNNIYVSGTIVCFKDDLVSTMFPDSALMSISTSLRWADADGNHWLNAYSNGAKSYIGEIVVESAKLGFDEMILSYFFFPNLANPGDLNYADGGVSKYDAVKNFLGSIKSSLGESAPNVKLGIDIPLRYFLTSPHEVTGINPNALIQSEVCDFIVTSFAPSEIPSSVSINGSVIQNAAQNPYDSVKTLCNYFSDYPQQIMFRPVLQAYDSSDGVKYGAENIMAQKQALYESGIKVWQLLNFENLY